MNGYAACFVIYIIGFGSNIQKLLKEPLIAYLLLGIFMHPNIEKCNVKDNNWNKIINFAEK